MTPAPWKFRGDTLSDSQDMPLYQVLPLSLNITIAEDMANRRAIECAPEMAAVLRQLAGLARREIERPLAQRTGFAEFERAALDLLAKLEGGA